MESRCQVAVMLQALSECQEPAKFMSLLVTHARLINNAWHYIGESGATNILRQQIWDTPGGLSAELQWHLPQEVACAQNCAHYKHGHGHP